MNYRMTIRSKVRLAVGAALIFPVIGAAQDEGTPPSWEIREMAEDIVKNAATGQKLLAELRPEEWLQNGAPEAYIEQLATLRADLENAALSAQSLSREPERLSYAVDTFLWLDRADSLLGSIAAGARNYYNGAVADLLDSARGRNVGNIASLKGYMRQLAVGLETSLRIAHGEAQRCRASVAGQANQP